MGKCIFNWCKKGGEPAEDAELAQPLKTTSLDGKEPRTFKGPWYKPFGDGSGADVAACCLAFHAPSCTYGWNASRGLGRSWWKEALKFFLLTSAVFFAIRVTLMVLMHTQCGAMMPPPPQPGMATAAAYPAGGARGPCKFWNTGHSTAAGAATTTGTGSTVSGASQGQPASVAATLLQPAMKTGTVDPAKAGSDDDDDDDDDDDGHHKHHHKHEHKHEHKHGHLHHHKHEKEEEEEEGKGANSMWGDMMMGRKWHVRRSAKEEQATQVGQVDVTKAEGDQEGDEDVNKADNDEQLDTKEEPDTKEEDEEEQVAKGVAQGESDQVGDEAVAKADNKEDDEKAEDKDEGKEEDGDKKDDNDDDDDDEDEDDDDDDDDKKQAAIAATTAATTGSAAAATAYATVQPGVGTWDTDADWHRAHHEAMEKCFARVGTTAVFLAAFGISCVLWALMLGAKRRAELRARFGIAGTFKQDAALWLCCAPCALAQETRTLMANNVEEGMWLGPHPGLAATQQPTVVVVAPVPQEKMAA